MGLDVGDMRIGVALSDPLGMMALPHSVVQTESPQVDADAIRRIARENEVIRIVAGLPLNQDGEPGPQAEKVLAFLDVLRGVVDVDVVTQDERFSTAAAQRSLISANVKRKNRKKVIDKVAAQHILQVYLDRQANTRARQEL
jgi:putative Holliday junction resolvase